MAYNIKKNYDLTMLNTLRLPSGAEFFMEIKNKRELISAINWAKSRKLPLTILAGGSNIIITRKKIKGLVLKISGEQHTIKKNIIFSWAGISLSKLAKISATAGLSGLEWSFGVPGSLGGAVRGNAGAYGGEIAQSVIEATIYDLSNDKYLKLNNKACRFSYRNSIFKQNKNLLILDIKLKMAAGEPKEIRKIIENNFQHRLKIQPRESSAGCIFKNLEYKKIIKQNTGLAHDLEANSLVKGGKIGAAYLIDRLGLKGKIKGGAKISEKHANFIINTGKAEAKDVINLIDFIKKEVKNMYKIDLEEEIQYI